MYKFKMMLGDKLFFAAMVIIPLLITVAAGYALRYEKLDIIPIAVVDEDGTEYSKLLVSRLDSKEGIGLQAKERKDALKMLERGKTEHVIIIKAGFGEAVKKGESKGLIELQSAPSSYSADLIREIAAGESIRIIMANMAANSVVTQYRDLGIKTGASFRNEVEAYADGLWEPKPLMTIDYREMKAGIVTGAEHPMLPAASASSAGLVTAFIMFYMLFGSSWLIEERMNGTIKRLGAGTGALQASFWGGVIALFTAGLLQIIIFSMIQRVFFNVTLFSGFSSFIVIAAYLMAVTAVSMFLSSILKTQAQLQAGAPVLALFTGFAGGCFWNFVQMPERIAKLALFTPQGWALQGINKLLTNPADIRAALQPAVVLLVMASILLPLSYNLVRKQTARS